MPDRVICITQEDLECPTKFDQNLLDWLNAINQSTKANCAAINDLPDSVDTLDCVETPQDFYINSQVQQINGAGSWVNTNEAANPTNILFNSGSGISIPFSHNGAGDGAWQDWPFSDNGASHDGEDPVNVILSTTVPDNVKTICIRFAGVDNGGITFITPPVSQTGYSGTTNNYAIEACFDTSNTKLVRWQKRNRDNALHLITLLEYCNVIPGVKIVCPDGTTTYRSPNGTVYTPTQITEV